MVVVEKVKVIEEISKKSVVKIYKSLKMREIIFNKLLYAPEFRWVGKCL